MEHWWGMKGLGRLMATGMVLVGCTSTAPERSGGLEHRLETAQPPGFLTGPISFVLTNGGSYRAHISVLTRSGTEAEKELFAGEIQALQSRVLVTPDHTKLHTRTDGRYSFLWNVSSNGGYVLSEALQAYAPVASPRQYTNVASQLSREAGKIAGHPCERAMFTTSTSDGQTESFEAWRAADLNGLALETRAAGSEPGVIVRLTRVQPGRISLELFEVPDGFTRYATLDALVNELMLRQQNRAHESDEDRLEMHAPPTERERRGYTRDQ